MGAQHTWERDARTGKQRRVKVAPPPPTPIRDEAPATPPPPDAAATPPPLNPAVEAALNSTGRAWVLLMGGEGEATYRAGAVYWHDGLSPHGVMDMALDGMTAAREAERTHLVRVYALVARGNGEDSDGSGTDGVPTETNEQEHRDATSEHGDV